ncbi:YHYH domain-containing protein [Mesorhizobium sp. BH1-1-4]|nr:YHYH domain-containing protein [Mesorhizobium sp. BH1-1-4]
MKSALISTISALTIWAFAASAHAHGGGTDSNGCHTNHKTGEYHCH